MMVAVFLLLREVGRLDDFFLSFSNIVLPVYMYYCSFALVSFQHTLGIRPFRIRSGCGPTRVLLLTAQSTAS